MPQITLRDYQKYCIDKATNKSIVCLPTGTGKSVVIAEIYQKHLDLNPCVVVPTLELKIQLTRSLKAFGINDPKVYCFKSAHKYAHSHELFLHDECHHTAAKTWSKIGTHGQHIGFTATPCRLDGQPLPFFDTIIEPYPVSYYFDNGYLETPTEYIIPFGFYSNELLDIIDNPDKKSTLNKFLFELSKHISKTNRSLFFVNDIQTAEKFANLLTSFNLCAKAIHSELPYKQRLEILDNFRDGIISALVNVAILTEGVDIPECDRVVILRQTQSVSLYYQIVGRGTRPNPGKDFKVLDFGGNLEKFGSVAKSGTWAEWVSQDIVDTLPTKRETSNSGNQVLKPMLPQRYGLSLEKYKHDAAQVVINQLIRNYRSRGRVEVKLWKSKLKGISLTDVQRSNLEACLINCVGPSIISYILE